MITPRRVFGARKCDGSSGSVCEKKRMHFRFCVVEESLLKQRTRTLPLGIVRIV